MVIAVVVEAVGLVGYRRAYGAVGRLSAHSLSIACP